MQIEITLKKYSDSEPELIEVDVPETGAMVKATDGIHIRRLLPTWKEGTPWTPKTARQRKGGTIGS